MSTLERLYLEHEPRVRWVIRARGVEASSVDDLVHESFMAILRRWPERDRSIRLATWVTRVARNIAFSHRRAEARRLRRLQELPVPPAPLPPDEAAAEREAWHELDAFARRLSPKLREAFVLADVGGMPVHEVAETCGVPVATMHSRLRLSRQHFAAYFGDRADANARAALLRRAAAEATPSRPQRRRSLAALLAAAKPPAAAASAWVAAAIVAAGLGGIAVLHHALDPEPGTGVGTQAPLATEPVATAPARPQSSRAASTVPATTTSAALPTPAAPPPAHARPRPERKAPADDSPAVLDPLTAHVAALEHARKLTRTGRPEQALAALDAVQRPASALARDHHRVVLRAACAAKLDARARQAARALAALGFPADGDAPCPDRPREPSQ